MLKKTLYFGLAAFLLIVGFGIGYFTQPIYQISPNNLDSNENWGLYDGKNEGDFVGEIDVTPLLNALNNAEWTNKNILKKGSWVLKTKNEIINLSYYGHFYWISGKPGFFLISQEYENEYNKFISEKVKNRVIEWRKSRNN